MFMFIIFQLQSVTVHSLANQDRAEQSRPIRSRVNTSPLDHSASVDQWMTATLVQTFISDINANTECWHRIRNVNQDVKNCAKGLSIFLPKTFKAIIFLIIELNVCSSKTLVYAYKYSNIVIWHPAHFVYPCFLNPAYFECPCFLNPAHFACPCFQNPA